MKASQTIKLSINQDSIKEIGTRTQIKKEWLNDFQQMIADKEETAIHNYEVGYAVYLKLNEIELDWNEVEKWTKDNNSNSLIRVKKAMSYIQ